MTPKASVRPDCEIVSSRLLSVAPAEAFAAFADPARLERWWGPKGFANTMQRFDFRAGGDWHILMHAPDGADYPNQSVFIEVTEPSRIVYDHGGHVFIGTLDYAAEGTGTRLTFTMRFPTPAERDQVAPVCIPANEENFDRLEAELARGRT
jgi:uncharacterized protein YndB with AHSA1/START domain